MGLPNLADLQKKCQDMGLTVQQKGKRPAKQEYVDVLRAHYLKTDYPEGMPFQETEPMLCFAEWNLKPEEQTAIWKDGNRWVAQRKLNGCRMIMHIVPGKGIFAHSRTISLRTYRFEELTDKLLIAGFKDWTGEAITLDVEAIVEKPVDTRPYTAKGEVTKSSLHSTTAILHLKRSLELQKDQEAPLMFKVFDVIRVGQKDGTKARYEERLSWVNEFFTQVARTEIGKFFNHVPVFPDGKRAFFEGVVKEGGEGVILKNLDSTYEASSSRLRNAWVKVKKRLEFDAFVSGYIRGNAETGYQNLVGALEFSVHTEKGTHVIGYGTNLTLEDRKKLTAYDQATDTVKLTQEMYGKVAEISGQDISARELRLSHCTINRWRDQPGDEKRAEDCKASMADLRAAAEWVG